MIREVIKDRIQDLGLTQKKVCEALGEHEQNLSSFTNGLRSYPYEKFVALLQTLGLTIGDRTQYVGQEPPERLRAVLEASIKSSGAKRKEIAELSGVNVSTLSSYLSGKRTICLATLEKLMDCLDLGVIAFGVPAIFSYDDNTSKQIAS